MKTSRVVLSLIYIYPYKFYTFFDYHYVMVRHVWSVPNIFWSGFLQRWGNFSPFDGKKSEFFNIDEEDWRSCIFWVWKEKRRP